LDCPGIRPIVPPPMPPHTYRISDATCPRPRPCSNAHRPVPAVYGEYGDDRCRPVRTKEEVIAVDSHRVLNTVSFT
jgi:hypothetical protein